MLNPENQFAIQIIALALAHRRRRVSGCPRMRRASEQMALRILLAAHKKGRTADEIAHLCDLPVEHVRIWLDEAKAIDVAKAREVLQAHTDD
jgi:hypothetical protein